jgi:hypothetical protein
VNLVLIFLVKDLLVFTSVGGSKRCESSLTSWICTSFSAGSQIQAVHGFEADFRGKASQT